MKLACIQPSYIPWKGYFHLIHEADCFVFYDDAQYSKGSWRNRNQIIINGSLKWLNIPVNKGAWHLPINQVTVAKPFAVEHWRLLTEAYRKLEYFPFFQKIVEKIICYDEPNLSHLTVFQTLELCKIFGIKTPTVLMSDLKINSFKRTEKLLAMCKNLGATEYISGPSAMGYIKEEKFVEAGIKLTYFAYNYPEYPQQSKNFTHYVSILDLIFNLGEEAPEYIWGKHACRS